MVCQSSYYQLAISFNLVLIGFVAMPFMKNYLLESNSVSPLCNHQVNYRLSFSLIILFLMIDLHLALLDPLTLELSH